MGVRTDREVMKRRMLTVRARAGYTFREPDKVQTSPSSRTMRRERIKSSLRRDKFKFNS